jgi:4-alpha-glucanotransferase
MRRAGILLPIFSLPSPYGIGTMGQGAFDFIDFLARSGQSLWQILPITPTSTHDSPYQGLSAFAGNPHLIDPAFLAREGLLTSKEATSQKHPMRQRTAGRVDYVWQKEIRMPLLMQAADRIGEDRRYRDFCRENAFWLDDFAHFMCGMFAQDEKPPDTYRRLQFLFFEQWRGMKRYANAKGIGIIGDLSFYVAESSADFAGNPKLFKVERKGARRGMPLTYAGVPPDDFSAEGQVWEMPVYDWAMHRRSGWVWWGQRLRQAATLYDACRIDHFRGFSEYYTIPVGAPASEGHWEKGPGRDFIDMIKKTAPALPIIAEDLGILTDEVHELRRYAGFPGMKVLQFAFNPNEESDYLPHRHTEHCVVYTGTHDNDTLKGWILKESRNVIKYMGAYLGIFRADALAAGVLRAALASVADVCVIPMQDWLGLGSETRINAPATVSVDNWSWRLNAGQISVRQAERIYAEVKRYGRVPETLIR